MATHCGSHALRQQEAVQQWAAQVHWDLSVCLHVPNARLQNSESDKIALQTHLAKALKRFDRKLLGRANKNRNVRVRRFVTQEYAHGTGLHVHMLLETPARSTQDRMRELLLQCWSDQFPAHPHLAFKRHLFWSEPTTGGYLRYSTKQIGRDGEVDVENTVLFYEPKHKHPRIGAQ